MSKLIAIVDTTIFCNVLGIPGRNQDRLTVIGEFETLININATLLLPMPVIFETGNFVAQIADGRVRRDYGEKFCRQVQLAAEGSAPWTPTPFPEKEEVLGYLSAFPEMAMRGVGIVDLSIIKLWERMRALGNGSTVYIWSLDQHLSAYDTRGSN